MLLKIPADPFEPSHLRTLETLHAVSRDNIQLLPIYEVPGTVLSALHVTTCEWLDTDLHVSGGMKKQTQRGSVAFAGRPRGLGGWSASAWLRSSCSLPPHEQFSHSARAGVLGTG